MHAFRVNATALPMHFDNLAWIAAPYNRTVVLTSSLLQPSPQNLVCVCVTPPTFVCKPFFVLFVLFVFNFFFVIGTFVVLSAHNFALSLAKHSALGHQLNVEHCGLYAHPFIRPNVLAIVRLSVWRSVACISCSLLTQRHFRQRRQLRC